MIHLLNDGQSKAAGKIGQFLDSHNRKGTFTLTGGPGTGKTFMLRAALDEHRNGKSVICGTISHAARNVLDGAMDSKYKCYTVAQLLGMSMRINESDGSYYFVPDRKVPKRIKDAAGGVLVLDEVSMIDDKLYADLQNEIDYHGIKCIAVGDPFQLPPVEQDHDSMFFNVIGAELTQTMRFGGSVSNLARVYHDGILSINNDERVSKWILNEQTLRKDDFDGTNGYLFENNLQRMLDNAAADIKNNYENKNHTRILAFKNEVVDYLNAETRLRIYGKNAKQFEPGEIVICNGGYSGNSDQRVLYNGEVLKVESFAEVDNHQSGLEVLKLKFKGKNHNHLPPVYTLKNTPGNIKKYNDKKNQLIKDAKENPRLWANYRWFMDSFAHFTYGYAQNLYKAQGATLSNVYVCEGEIMGIKPLTLKQKFQGLYVAMTRATDKVCIYNKDF